MSDFLERTFEFRLKLAMHESRKRMKKQLDNLPNRLLQIWSDNKQSAATRRQKILEIWDTLERPLPDHSDRVIHHETHSALDSERSQMATKARNRIVQFVRRHLPATSPDRFTDDELRTFNAKRPVSDNFSPYVIYGPENPGSTKSQRERTPVQ